METFMSARLDVPPPFPFPFDDGTIVDEKAEATEPWKNRLVQHRGQNRRTARTIPNAPKGTKRKRQAIRGGKIKHRKSFTSF